MKRNYWLMLTILLLLMIMLYRILQYGNMIGSNGNSICYHILYVTAFLSSIMSAVVQWRNNKKSGSNN